MEKDKTLIVKNVPATIHRKLKIKSARTDKSIQLLVLEAIKESLIK